MLSDGADLVTMFEGEMHLICVCVCVCVFCSAYLKRCRLRVGQNRIYAPYMTVCMVISMLKVPYVHRIYV
jgi:hypothetical protein